MIEGNYRMNNIKTYKTSLVYIILFTIIFLSNTIENYILCQTTCFVLLAILILVALIKFIYNKFDIRNTSKKNILFLFLKFNLGIKIVMHIYSIILSQINLTDSRFLSSNIMTYINAVSAIAVVYLIGERAWAISLFSLILTWLIAIIETFLRYGNMFFHYIEFNDLAFATGYLFIYYSMFKRRWSKKEFIYFTIALLIIMTACKRIGIAGLFIAIIANFILGGKSKKKIYRIISKIISFGFIIGSYIFIYLITTGKLFLFLDEYLNDSIQFMMGRTFYWKALGEFCVFSPKFLGHGRNASATLFANEYAYMRVGNVHSDILKNYMECGFILFGIWLFNYFVVFKNSIEKRINYSAMKVYFILTIYTFFVYFTDNTETYPITQYFYMLIPIIYSLRSVKSKKDCFAFEL